MEQLKVQPPVVIYGRRGYSFPYAIYLHGTAAILKNLVSYASGAHEGFDKDIFIETPRLGNGKVKISICLPDNYNKRPKPVILVLEGGGFVLGEPKDGAKNDRKLTKETGAIVISIDYAKSPRYDYPHALLQAYAVLKWALSTKAELNGIFVDHARVGIMGNSAGGNLTAALSLLISFNSGPCAAFRKELGPDFQQVLQVLLYPSVELHHSYTTRFERTSPDVQAKSLPTWVATMMEGSYLPPYIEKEQIFVAPLVADVGLLRELKIPKTLVITAGKDCLKDEAAAYAENLKAAGHEVSLTEYPESIHGFTHYQEGSKEYRGEDVVGSWMEVCRAFNEAFSLG
ncbi:alpha/beta hydrolase fold-domain-containing protein [Cadophora sp. MPI-SDFR-AT-0126]|nr:alpha/beta hydrolase fold-domain-containing protein [Leotiomycetes sp. MPI-SDFR-AT-0126]